MKPGMGTFEEFMMHPASAVFWEFLRLVEIEPYNEMIQKWWLEKVQQNPNPVSKLERYLTALGYYNQLTKEFWSQIAFNITMETQESIVTTLTRLGDFLRLAAFECPLINEYFEVAKKIALDKPKVHIIREHFKQLWPTSMNITCLHYKKLQ